MWWNDFDEENLDKIVIDPSLAVFKTIPGNVEGPSVACAGLYFRCWWWWHTRWWWWWWGWWPVCHTPVFSSPPSAARSLPLCPVLSNHRKLKQSISSLLSFKQFFYLGVCHWITPRFSFLRFLLVKTFQFSPFLVQTSISWCSAIVHPTSQSPLKIHWIIS